MDRERCGLKCRAQLGRMQVKLLHHRFSLTPIFRQRNDKLISPNIFVFSDRKEDEITSEKKIQGDIRSLLGGLPREGRR
ncbi:hypothetical protein RUM44_002935 [Polyplax serrata]|uniref:Uncharacterized protein n=1 Tax=Polyplax serrata TaxID=468196 RepID=A0ABR1AX42_POLSC